jgi:hypothetical protein
MGTAILSLVALLLLIPPIAEAKGSGGGSGGGHSSGGHASGSHSSSGHSSGGHTSGGHTSGSHASRSHSFGSHPSGHSTGGAKAHSHSYHAPQGPSGTHRKNYSQTAPRDNRGHIQRSGKAKDAFKKSHPCPSTGKSSGACPGYVIDHIKALKRGGADAPSNMQWQTKEAARQKDKSE